MPGVSSTSRPGTPGGAIAMLAIGSGARRAHRSATDAGPRKFPSAPPRMMTPSRLRLSHRSKTKLRLMPSLRGAPSTPPANTTMSTSRRYATSEMPASSVVW
jgi:hypothetical protein